MIIDLKTWMMLVTATLLVHAAHAELVQRLVPAQSSIVFTSRQMGVPVDGSFKKFDAQIAFDLKKPEAAKVNLSIALGSVALGVSETEAELAKPSWFSTRQFPNATFQSTVVKPVGTGKFEVVEIGRAHV